MYATSMNVSWNGFDFHKFVRIVLLAALLTVGALQATRCQENTDEDVNTVVRDQYGRMYGEDK
jgi:hypothetical protein